MAALATELVLEAVDPPVRVGVALQIVELHSEREGDGVRVLLPGRREEAGVEASVEEAKLPVG